MSDCCHITSMVGIVMSLALVCWRRLVYADNLTIRANHIASLRKIFKKQLALSFSVRVVPCI